jgi:type II secretory ATPase GspE/PulE/Tfp pilus assembly ATPase PilB-like protein
MQYRKRIGERFIEAGLITEEQLAIALEEQKKTGELLGAILYGFGFITRKDLFTVLSMSHGGENREEEEINVPDDLSDIVRQSRSVLKRAEQETGRIADLSLAPIVRLVERVIITGLNKGVSDIHIGPDSRGARVRYRIDGQLLHGMYLPKDVLPAIVSRIKIMGSMNIAENRVPQDGSAEFEWNSKVLDIRISTFPVVGGENIVMRVLDKSQILLGLENLGFNKDAIELLSDSLNMPHGMILVTGPTGAGKTTTLYSVLSIINSVHKNIITVEDPIEYQLPLVRQSQVNVKAGLTFAVGLRSILRHDPDVILVGEMRDIETAELAIRSSLTGHLVFSTLHTNDAVSSLPRLIDMGVEPFLVTSTVDTVISQRLVRVLCTKCREAYTPLPDLIKKMAVPAKEKIILYKAKGCQECGNTGYKGRTVIYEIMKMNESLRNLVLMRAGTDRLIAAAKENGMETMYEIGIKKVIAGITSLEEVHSATRIPF